MKKINSNCIIICSVLLIYLLIKNIIFIPNSLVTYTYTINPIFWIIETILCIVLLNNVYARRFNENDNFQTLLILLLLYLIIYFSLGLVFGYQKSPYSYNIITITKNIWSVLLVSILEEICRFSLIKSVRKNKTFYVIVTIIFILLEFNLKEIVANTDTFENAFIYLSKNTIPIIVKNILLTSFALDYGMSLNIIYKAFMKALIIFLPIMPDLNWFVTGFSGCIVPLCVFMTLTYTSNRREINRYKERGKKQNILLDSIFYVIVFIVILFLVGAFRYRPVAIMSNSMKPNFARGDVVVYEKINYKNLTSIDEETIIIYEKGKSLIIHRVIRVIEEDGKTMYITKGDNNGNQDSDPVEQVQIRGIVKFTIKYLGYPSVLIKNIIGGKEKNIET